MDRRGADRPAEARTDAAAALALDPDNVMARLLRSALDHAPITADQARAMTAAHRDDWRAWWVAAGALSHEGADANQVANARAAACALFAQNPALVAPSDLCADRPAGGSPSITRLRCRTGAASSTAWCG